MYTYVFWGLEDTGQKLFENFNIHCDLVSK